MGSVKTNRLGMPLLRNDPPERTRNVSRRLRCAEAIGVVVKEKTVDELKKHRSLAVGRYNVLLPAVCDDDSLEIHSMIQAACTTGTSAPGM